MVTDSDKHWDRIEGNFTSYSPKMIKQRSRNEKLVFGTDTILIKKIKYSDEIENAWQGKVWDIEKMPGKRTSPRKGACIFQMIRGEEL